MRNVIMTAAALVLFAVFFGDAAMAAAAGGPSGAVETTFIAQVVVLILVGRLLGEAMERIGQPAVVGQLLAGMLLGPSFFGWIWPAAHNLVFPPAAEQKSMIDAVSQLGILMLLLLTGMETDLKLVRRVGAKVFTISAAGIAVPFACGFLLGEFLPVSMVAEPARRLVMSLFLGTALSISSIKIVAMVVREMNFMRRTLGQTIVASAILEDSIGWIIIAVTIGIAGRGGAQAFKPFLQTLVYVAIFMGLSFTLGRRLVFWLIRWVNDTFESEFAVISAILVVMGVMALLTDAIGVHTVLGAFIAGVLVGESPILTGHIQEQIRGLILALFAPVFFGLSGLGADLTILKNFDLAMLTVLIVVIASIGKFTGAFLGGAVGGLSWRESLAVGCGMNARGSTEVIVATIGLSMGVLSQNLFTMIVSMAVITTSAMPPMLRWALARLPFDREEQKRLEREEIDAKGFVSRFERLLIAADPSPCGRLATRMAGFVAGQRGMPVTVLHPEPDPDEVREDQDEAAAPFERVVKNAAKESSESAQREKGDDKPRKVDITTRAESGGMHEAVAVEAEKGYDILFIGIADMCDRDGQFTRHVNQIAQAFEGPLALAVSGASDADDPERQRYNILVPVNGTDASRRGAELAFALAPSQDVNFTALHVSDRGPSGTQRRSRFSPQSRAERAILLDIKALARRYGHTIRTSIHVHASPEDAILREADRMNADLIVIGAGRRTGETLFLGRTVSHVLKRWSGAVLAVAS